MAAYSKAPNIDAPRQPENYTFRGRNAPSNGEGEMALLALSHTPVEHLLYTAMRGETSTEDGCQGIFSVRRLMQLTGLNSYSTVRRGRDGLLNKKSIEASLIEAPEGKRTVYRVFNPLEIFSRRRDAGIPPYPKELDSYAAFPGFGRALERVLDGFSLSRREAQVALACAEGLTNSEIGEKLFISEQTVKFHLSHIFVKLGVRRRAELISRLLAQVA
jgi:DNA-binding CsgD family transcriptional regulator